MRTFVQPGKSITVTVPSGGVTSGVGVLIGTLFGISEVTAAVGERANILTEGEVEIAKTSALAVTEGAALFWDNTNKVVNLTSAAQKLVGIATKAASNPSSTITMKIIQNGL